MFKLEDYSTAIEWCNDGLGVINIGRGLTGREGGGRVVVVIALGQGSREFRGQKGQLGFDSSRD